MATVNFFIRTSSDDPKKFVPVRCRLIVGRENQVFAHTGFKVIARHWSKENQRVRKVAEATYKDDVNSGLLDLEAGITSALASYTGPVTKEWLASTIKKINNPESEVKESSDKITLFSFIQEFVDNAPKRINPKTGNPVTYKVQREYAASFEYLKKYAQKIKRALDFKDIDLKFHQDYTAFLQNQKIKQKINGEIVEVPMAKNTIGKKIQTLKTFLNAASEQGIEVNAAYKSLKFVSVKEETDGIYLNEKELEAMEQLDLSKDKKLEKARDLFLVGCWTGLRYGDWNKVKPENIDDNFLEISLNKSGTREKIAIPLHPCIVALFEKYQGRLPEMISDQKMRDYIKDVGKLAGIDTPYSHTVTRDNKPFTVTMPKWQAIGTHTARRSFATNLYKSKFPPIAIMKITGHKSEAIFLKYIKVTPREHAEMLKEHWNSFTKVKSL